ncbi:MAG TPA: polysaccharide biosynthesis protein [Candidatus Mediterraneibacter intestinigallinarum]|nr:polysaccharide biosynthesis protein [Candidatus Mediterraneibacter intestinigallinarum]
MCGQKKRGDYIWMKRAILLLFLDIVSILVSYLAALLLRFDFIFSNIPREYLEGYFWSMPYWTVITVVVFYGFRLYHSIWRFAGLDEAKRIIWSYIALIFLYTAGIFAMDLRMPRSYFFIGYVFSILMTTALRFAYRLIRSVTKNMENDGSTAVERVMIIGGGQAGQVLIRELQTSSHLHSKVCCVIDDNPNKKGRLLEGVPIVGNRYDIEEKVKEYGITRIIYAIPATTGANRKAILNICKNTGCKMQTVPGVYQLLNEEVSVTKLRDVEITDLLGRAQVKVNNSEILKSLKGKVIMVTGGGGSIGSELCRQIARSEPAALIIFDIYENNAYTIQQELKRKHPELNLITLIGSVRNTRRVDSIIEKYRPEVIFHAAAHKHVPLMEDSPNEAIKNNVEGTYKVAQSAARWGVKKFVLISTDKAVNPTNIMGASKRLCEMVVQMMNRQSDTDFVAVRFGNVLGSNGSVIPLFKKQIAEGGPVTVTDKRIIRYFMTIPEAVSLVLQASYYAHGGEIFVLDMGEPVKIDDLARNLIRLSGFVPDDDIKIVYTGLRPGEKLYEELLMDEEGMQETENELIFIGKPIEMDDEDFKHKLELLDKESRAESDKIKEIVAEIVPTYHPDLEHNQ